MHCATDGPRYDIAHIVARIAGEEGRDHPRQKLVRWLRAEGLEQLIGPLNRAYAQRTDIERRNAPASAVFAACRSCDDLTAVFGRTPYFAITDGLHPLY